MKIKEGFTLCPYLGKTVVIPIGELEDKFPGVIKINEPSVDVWKWIEEGKSVEEIYSLYFDTYSVDESDARCEVDLIIDNMVKSGVLED